MSDPVSLSLATGIQLADGEWHILAPNSLGAVIDPAFMDPTTGLLITPGDQWVQFVDDGGQAYAAPFRAILAVKLAAPAA